jgi:hypothetical protein
LGESLELRPSVGDTCLGSADLGFASQSFFGALAGAKRG